MTTSAFITATLPGDAAPRWLPLGAVNGSEHGSAVLLGDGRVLYVYTGGGGAISMGYAPDVATFIGADNSVVFFQDIFTGLSNQRATVFRSPIDNAIYLSVTTFNAGAGGLGGDHTRIYTTVDDGVTWTFHGTVQGAVGGSDAGIEEPCVTGEPYFDLGSGRWIMSAPRYRVAFGGRITQAGVWYSDDQGVTWTQGAASAASPFGSNIEGCSRNIMLHEGPAGDVLWWNANGGFTGYGYRLFTSMDTGTTWQTISVAPGGASNFGRAFGWRDSTDTMYALVQGTQIRSWPAGLPSGGDPPWPEDEATIVRSFANLTGFGNPRNGIIQLLGSDTMVLMYAGQVIGWPYESDDDCDCPYITVTINLTGGVSSHEWQVIHPLTLEVFSGQIDPGDPPVLVRLCGPFPNGDYLVDITCEPGT